MNCFQHAPVAAVGLCKNCQRGICLECLTDLGDGLACRNRCEQKVQALNTLLNRSPGVYSAAGSGYRIVGAMLLAVAAMSLLAGATDAQAKGWLNGSVLAGLAFAFFGVLFFRLARRYR
ncbi:hypothetical protein [Myxococcus qinghaiensis]|uniref:hypothetical protein n=1 Tax=Myxococcus qinghaiensis TaxID=2906758 RepID=UPI0020A78822|nr:hypothetical protein [Myxococcus qinghaiensis]MCP3166397.1 hypothetical protein [Myxococcus qinghaiensis]